MFRKPRRRGGHREGGNDVFDNPTFFFKPLLLSFSFWRLFGLLLLLLQCPLQLWPQVGFVFPEKLSGKEETLGGKKGKKFSSGQETAENFFEYIKNTASHHQQSFPPFFKTFLVCFLSFFFFLSLSLVMFHSEGGRTAEVASPSFSSSPLAIDISFSGGGKKRKRGNVGSIPSPTCAGGKKLSWREKRFFAFPKKWGNASKKTFLCLSIQAQNVEN